jgi:hypothetical protein
MNIAILLVIAAAVALGIILRSTVARSLRPRVGANGADTIKTGTIESGTIKSGMIETGTIRPIDMEAFRNLTNPAEDQFLRVRLPVAEFRKVRRARLRAMAAYVTVAGSNAAVLVAAGEAALASGDPRFLHPAEELVHQALLLRRNTTVALLRIQWALAWPASRFAAVRVVDRYERLSGSAMLLGRLQNPAMTVRLSTRG